MTRSDQFSESETNLNFIKVTWENLVNECLIFKSSKIDNKKCFDPNFVMHTRPEMSQQSSKMFFISEMHIQPEALKVVRLKNHNRPLQKKESKVVEKEIAKVKLNLENHRLLTKKEIDEIIHKKIKSSSCISKFAKFYPKLPKRLEYYDVIYKVNDICSQHIHMVAETKNSHQKIPIGTRTISKKNELTEEILESVFNHKYNLTEFDIENEKHVLEIAERNNEIIKKFSEKGTKKLNQILLNDIKEKFKIAKEVELQKKINQEILENSWKTWKEYAQQLKNRRKEKTIYICKIESFLSYLQERKTKHLKHEMSRKKEIKTNHILENLVKIRREQKTKEEKEEKLKKLMQEVKTSQADTKKKLQEIMKSNSNNEGKFSNHNFLQKIEKRRQERLKCRKEIQEKKLKLKEEREKIRIEEEKERNQREKQIRLEELKKKRSLEKERELEQKQKREKLRLNIKLAESHYKTYLLRSHGWRPWVMLLKIRDLQYQRAVAFYENRIKQKILRKWMAHVKEHVEKVTVRAENFYKSTLKKKCLSIWKRNLEMRKNQDQVAVDWNEFKITETAFKKWLQFTQHEILEYLNKKEIVELFYERKLKTKYMEKLKAYPEFNKMEQVKEIRKRMWRQKIKEILPDYQPIEVSE